MADLIHLFGQISHTRLAQMVRSLADQTVVEIRATKSACNERRSLTIGCVDLDCNRVSESSLNRDENYTIVTDVAENFVVAQLAERKLTPVAMRKQILKRVKRLSK